MFSLLKNEVMKTKEIIDNKNNYRQILVEKNN